MIERRVVIAIDGPVGAGKSAVAGLVAKMIGIRHIDTGALYRAIGLKLRNNLLPRETLPYLLQTLPRLKKLLSETEIRFTPSGAVYLDGEEISDAIRSTRASEDASVCAGNSEVRRKLLELQRSIAGEGGVVMEGRDIGTVVLPTADFKIYLDASIEERAKRRHLEMMSKFGESNFAAVLDSIKERDLRDMNREIAPLKPAPDSFRIDSTGMSAEEAAEAIVELVREKRRGMQ